MTLIAHRGGWSASLGDIASVIVPEETESYKPVAYSRLIEEVKLHLPRFGLTVEREDYALGRDGQQLFGVLTCRNGVAQNGYNLALGLRSSYDRSLAVELVAGARVFVCDNLSFSGESKASRKHTINVFRDLPELIYKMLSAVSVQKARMVQEIDSMRVTPVDDPLAHHIMVTAVKRNAIPASKLPQVLEQWLRPPHEEFKPRTAWSLYNAFTEVCKSRSPADQMDGTLRLTQVLRSVLSEAGS